MKSLPWSAGKAMGFDRARDVGCALRQLEFSAHGFQHLGQGNIIWFARQRIAAMHTFFAVEQPCAFEIAGDLLEEGEREVVALRDRVQRNPRLAFCLGKRAHDQNCVVLLS